MVLCVGMHAQTSSCTFRLRGHVVDDAAAKPLPYAEVWVKGASQKGTLTDATGSFELTGLCAGPLTLMTAHLGYGIVETELNIGSDTAFLHVHLMPNASTLNSIAIHSHRDKPQTYAQTQTVAGIDADELEKLRGLSLGESLKSIPGISAIQNGANISKPVIHGLHSNRILILNNGVRQEGQQWGGEHGPELDPFIASRITVIKGAASIRYGADAMGGVILLEPPTWRIKPGIGGEVNLIGASNGGGLTASGLVEGTLDKKANGLSWRVQGTLKKSGNIRTANYYLKNTGMEEGDLSAAIAYRRETYGVEAYYSQYNAKIGIFTGSHVGNLNDLLMAFNSPQPIATAGLAYPIGRPYQVVNHHLLKVSGYKNLKKAGKLEVVYSYQNDRRREFQADVVYSTNPAIKYKPQVDFSLGTHTVEVLFSHLPRNGFSGMVGASGMWQNNDYRGLLPLIPDYRNLGAGVFAFERWSQEHITIEAGVRYDYRQMRVLDKHNADLRYQNVSGSIGIQYRPAVHWSLSAHYGSAWRPPAASELYISGIHQSAASYELGDSTLRREQAHTFNVAARYDGPRVQVEVGGYANLINNYIYAKPAMQVVTLVSGTYPLFRYTQANVLFTGADIDVDYNIWKGFHWLNKTSLIWSYNRSTRDYLVLTPTHRMENTLRYTWKKAGPLKELYVGITNIAVARQTRVPANSDYVNPPAGYILFNADFGFAVPLGPRKLAVNATVYNFTNRAYRDYLNRFRYFADEAGVNFVLRLKFSF